MAKAIGVNWTRFHDAGLEYIGWLMKAVDLFDNAVASGAPLEMK